jgi:hypothetical protein
MRRRAAAAWIAAAIALAARAAAAEDLPELVIGEGDERLLEAFGGALEKRVDICSRSRIAVAP